MEDAPKTIVLSGHLPLTEGKVGLGGYLFNDRTGPLNRTGLSLAYAYHLELTKKLNLSLGVFGGFIQYRIDGNHIHLADEEERSLFDGIGSAFVPDASLGIRLSGEKWYAGIALNQLLHNKIRSKSIGNITDSYGTLEYHTSITGAYLFPLGNEFEITPSVLIKILTEKLIQADVNAKLSYLKQYWLGVSYRSADILSLLVGYDFNKKLYAAYAYDLTTKGLQNYSTGSHEFVLGYRFIDNHITSDKRRTLD